MAFMRSKFGDDRPAGKLSRTAPVLSAITRWVVAPSAGIGLSLWLVASMAGAYSAGTSLSSTTTFMPRVPRELASDTTVKQEKSQRLIEVAVAGPDGGSHSGKPSTGERFEMARAALSPQKLAAAFAKSGMVLAKEESAPAVLPLKERFDIAAANNPHGPTPVRFGQRSEVERSSRLALALAGAASVELAYAATSAPGSDDAPFNRLFVSPEGMSDADDQDNVAVFDELPDNIPLPGRRPKVDDSPASKPERAPVSRTAKTRDDDAPRKPTRTRDSSQMLAYAKPDDPKEGGGLFSGLFSRQAPSGKSGVAVYDISAATVTMPDGTVLEAHSGIGKMADNARYAHERMRGPTPPGTYKLSIRESLFHGVEAIRMTPVSGDTYGRTGFLAHTELLRGRPEQSHGCVAFKDYKHFLKAFKKGRITQMVVKG
jgi:hypothetical protein